MATADTAKLLASLDMDTRKFQAGGKKAIGTLDRLSTKTIAVGTAIGVGLERLAEKGIRALTGAVQGGLNSLAELEDATTSVDGALKQVGKGWTITSAQIADKANMIEAATQAAFDDKDITAAATTLIRYGKITQDNLFPAMEVMTDLAARIGSVEGASDALAKALADPTKATRLLRTAGVTLTEDQQKRIKLWVKDGKLAQAQAFLLKEVAKQTKGAAAAMHGPFRDSQLMLADVVEDAQRALGTGLLPVIMEVRKELSEQLAKPETLERIKRFGEGLADGLRSVVGFIKTVPWDQVGAVLAGAVDFGKNIANAFLSLPTEAKGLILGLAALNKLSGGAVINVGVDLLKGAGGTLFQQFLGKGSPVNPMYVVPLGGGLGGGGVGGAGGAGAAANAGGLLAPGLGTLGAGLAGILAAYQLPLIFQRPKGTAQPMNTRLGEVSATRTDELTGLIPGFRALAERFGGATPVEVTMKTAPWIGPISERILEQKAAVDRARESAEANRIALVSSQKTGDASIIGAIRNNRPSVTVNVRTQVTTGQIARAKIVSATYSTGHIGAEIGK